MSRNTSVVRCIDDGAESEEGAIWYNISVYKFHTFREIGGKASRSPIELIEVALPIAIKVVVLSMSLRERTSTRMSKCCIKSMLRIGWWTCAMRKTNGNWRLGPRSSVSSLWPYVGITVLWATRRQAHLVWAEFSQVCAALRSLYLPTSCSILLIHSE